LLVGDTGDRFLQETLEEILKHLGGMRVTTGERAIELVKATDFQAILVDATAIRDFGMLVSQIRLVKPGLNIIVLTASPTWELAREAFMCGATDYVVKSLDRDHLAREIYRALNRPVLPWPR
jgi:DNA-binding NtrC family response regulator